VNVANSGRLTTKAEKIKRHRRDRQIYIFGFLVLVLAFFAFVAVNIYQGRMAAPVSYAFVTNASDAENDVTLPCPPTGEDAMPMTADQISVRTLNATEETGLARIFLEDLTGRSFVGVQATNWNQQYEGLARITFGKKGLRQAYTVANQFPEFELVYDDRDSALVDIILGDAAVNAELRPLYAPELSLDLELTAPGRCLPIDLLFPVPGPARLPADPLAPEPSPSPSLSVSPAA
jgi:hypothetical protein